MLACIYGNVSEAFVGMAMTYTLLVSMHSSFNLAEPIHVWISLTVQLLITKLCPLHISSN